MAIGCGKAGMDPITVSTMFKEAFEIENIYLPQLFLDCINKTKHIDTKSVIKPKGKLLHQEYFANTMIWRLYGDGTLEISGYGNMPNYKNHWDSYFGEGQAPWIGCERYGVLPNKLIISTGIIYVGANAFESFGCLKEVYLAPSVSKLGKMAFFDCYNIEKINVTPNIPITDLGVAELPLYYNNDYVRIGEWLFDKSIVRDD